MPDSFAMSLKRIEDTGVAAWSASRPVKTVKRADRDFTTSYHLATTELCWATRLGRCMPRPYGFRHLPVGVQHAAPARSPRQVSAPQCRKPSRFPRQYNFSNMIAALHALVRGACFR